jgi:two-component system chemotaxis response regulator CheY
LTPLCGDLGFGVPSGDQPSMTMLDAARRAATTIPEEPTKMSARVLVADDSSTMRKIILRSLSAVGIPSAIEAADGEEAINLFQPGEFDLVLTDWNMPRKNGLEVIQEIRKQDTDVTIIMVTTEAEKSRVLEAIQAGVSDYLVKPFTADTLREKLEKHGC